MYKKNILFVFLLLSLQVVFSQSSIRNELEKQKQLIQKELKQINDLLFRTNKQKAVAYSDIENITLKIQRKQEIIKLTNRQINLLNDEISQNIETKDNLEKNLEEIKTAYKQMILRSYKAKSGKNKLMFVLSAENFFQAFKRTQYIKQYTTYRRNQVKKIVALTEEISRVINDLSQRLELKKDLLEKNRANQKILETEKNQINKIAFQLRSQEKNYKKNIILKQKESERIDKEIERLIKEAIEASNRKKEKSSNFSLTPEAMALEKSFELNKGKLPWPVSRGVVIQKFGTQPHPVVRTTTIKSNGIIIATEKSEKVKTIFKGIVLSVLKFRGSSPTVLVQHGNYITAYKNLSKVFVEKGESLESGQAIGEVYTNESSGKSTLQFSVFKKTTPLNPMYWIIKM
ncbi:MAG: peptidoglycan DD-metalloendopeptidase family protein [Flavobacteriaceae bacterium]|nr:peptidoglycan DD-metalloendopeptidase family protein [Flavobacteriaceae bacterium]